MNRNFPVTVRKNHFLPAKLPAKFALAQVFLILLSVSVNATLPGYVDRTFGASGRAVADFGNSYDKGFAFTMQQDGKIVVVGSRTSPDGNTDFGIARFNADGSLDNNFGVNGKVTTDFGNEYDEAHGVVIQPDGKILVGGSGSNWGNATGLKLARYNGDGSLDNSFGTSGKINLLVGGQKVYFAKMVLQPDGKMVVAAITGNIAINVAPNDRLLLVRFNSDGSLDNSFGNNGQIIYPTRLSSSYVALELQPDGKLVVATTMYNTFSVLRFNSDGSIDRNFGRRSPFGQPGMVTTYFTYQGNTAIWVVPTSVVIQPDDKILVAGNFRSDEGNKSALVRYESDGSLDTDFVPNNNRELKSSNSFFSQIQKILLLPDGGFYLVSADTGLFRYRRNGTLDNSFGTDGRIRSLYNIIEVSDAILLNNGNILISGSYQSLQSTTDFAVQRISAQPIRTAPRGDFDGDGKTDFAVYRTNGWWIILGSRNNSLIEIYIPASALLPNDYNNDGRTDTVGYGGGVWRMPALNESNSSGFRELTFGQNTDRPFSADFDGDGCADFTIFDTVQGGWQVMLSQKNYYSPRIIDRISFGFGTDKPVPADYDGDGRDDIAVFRPSQGVWYIWQSSDNSVRGISFGIASDQLVPGDYDGDGKTDQAVYRNGVWYVLQSLDNSVYTANWGLNGDIPVPGDYDGDSKLDIAVFRPSNGTWYVRKSSDSSLLYVQWGRSTDAPVPIGYLP